MNATKPAQQYELRFQSLRDERRAYAFPCDARGRVDMDTLTCSALNDYLFARAFIGREFSMPSVRQAKAKATP